MNFQKGIKLDFICMKMKLMKKKYLQHSKNFHERYLYGKLQQILHLGLISRSYAPCTCNFPMLMHFVLILTSTLDLKLIFMFSVTTKLPVV